MQLQLPGKAVIARDFRGIIAAAIALPADAKFFAAEEGIIGQLPPQPKQQIYAVRNTLQTLIFPFDFGKLCFGGGAGFVGVVVVIGPEHIKALRDLNIQHVIGRAKEGL